MKKKSPGISIIIPTYNGGDVFRECLSEIAAQRYSGPVELIVIDSGSTDGTLEAARDFGAHTISIPQKDFHHSRTRNYVLKAASYPLVVFTVQDAIPASHTWLEVLSGSLVSPRVVAASGAQFPHAGADLYASAEVDFHREYLGAGFQTFSLDSSSEKRESYDTLLRKIRLDNVSSIYRTDIIRDIPFPEVRFGEDMAWAYSALRKSYRIAYNPSAAVYHSHNRPPDYRFRRSLIDTIMRAEILSMVRKDLSWVSFAQYQDLYGNMLEFSEKISSHYIDSLLRDTVKNKLLREMINIGHTVGNIKFRRLAEMGSHIDRSDATWSKSYLNHFRRIVHFLLILVIHRYRGATVAELASFVSHHSHTILGRLLGDIYASKLLRGVPTSEFDSFVDSNITGV
jgi:glycosyltransferase involved in cell wall biosynthesis